MSPTVVIEEVNQTIEIQDGDYTTILEIPQEIVSIVEVGIQGPAGITTGADKYYSQSFYTASSVNVNHGLSKRPAVTVIDSAGDEVEGDVYHVDSNNLTVTFSAPFSGIVTCN